MVPCKSTAKGIHLKGHTIGILMTNLEDRTTQVSIIIIDIINHIPNLSMHKQLPAYVECLNIIVYKCWQIMQWWCMLWCILQFYAMSWKVKTFETWLKCRNNIYFLESPVFGLNLSLPREFTSDLNRNMPSVPNVLTTVVGQREPGCYSQVSCILYTQWTILQ